MRRQTGMGQLSQLINGINAGYRMVQDARSDDDDAGFRKEQRDRMRRQWSDEDALKVSMQDAAAPTAAESGEVFQPAVDDDGNAMPANPTAGTFKAGGQRFSSMGEAQKAAASYNAPDAVAGRMSQALMKAGRPAEAAQVRGSARQEKVAELQFANLLQDQQRATAFRSLGSALQKGGWGAVPKIYESYDDGMTARVVEDGKGGATVHQVDAAGKEVGKQQFNSLGDFFGAAVAGYDPKLWLERQDQKAALGRADAAAAEGKDRWQKEFKLREEAERRRAGHDASMLEIARTKAGDADSKIPPAVKLRAEGLRTQLSQINNAITKSQAEGMWQAGGEGAKQLTATQAALRLQLRTLLEPYSGGDAANADPLGMNSDAQPPRQPGGPAPAPEGRQSSQPAASAPSQGGSMASMGQALGQAQREASQQGAEYQYLQRLSNEARNGGRALTERERALARQYGIS